jgi:hypothetical protein
MQHKILIVAGDTDHYESFLRDIQRSLASQSNPASSLLPKLSMPNSYQYHGINLRPGNRQLYHYTNKES